MGQNTLNSRQPTCQLEIKQNIRKTPTSVSPVPDASAPAQVVLFEPYATPAALATVFGDLVSLELVS